MNTQKIVGGILLISVGFVAGWFIPHPAKPGVELEPVQIQETESKPDIVAKLPSNKFFELFDTFTMNKDMGYPKNIVLGYPEKHLIAFQYPTSQETASYGVYDYSKNILYKNIGSEYTVGGETPVAFVGSDRLLMYNATPEDKKYSLSIRDFNNNLTKTVLTGKSVDEVYGDPSKELTIRTNAGTYLLNIQTLELAQKPQ